MNFGMTILSQSKETEQKLCYTDTDSFAIYIKTEDFLKVFLMMLRDGLTDLTMIKMIKDHFQ